MAVSENRLEKLFLSALDLSTGERAAFLDTECRDDHELKARLAALLKSDEKAENDSFLEKNAVELTVHELTGEFHDARLGQTIGHYRIIEKISAGGMGAVYLASRSDGQFEKKVALKLIKRGMDSEAILQRFLLERQILANLEHPNIARLLDAGMTADGLPFFVMEYVEGVPVTEFCKARELGLNERLELFLAVCSAVSYAHQNLIVHRDLKPSNILVTAEGKPKLLDFGIAKLLNSNDAENVTKTDFRILTPQYASPEQVRGEPITTASDTYGLGVILYELLTQNPPYQVTDKNLGEIIRIVCETEPTRPSSVVSFKFQVPSSKSKEINPKSQISNPKSLRGDLDNIVLKALQKEPLRRYSSVEKFAEDIRRHIVGLPITARADTFHYRAGKFIRRNRLGLGALALVFLVLLGGIAATLWQARKAQFSRERAERRSENLRRLSSSFAVELHNEILNLPGSLHARQLLLTRAVEQLDALAAESEDDPVLQDELAQGYYNLGLLPNLEVAQIAQNFQKGIDLYTKLLAKDSRNLHFNQQLAKGYLELANVEKVRGKSLVSLEFLQKTGTILESVLAIAPSDFETRKLLFEVESDKGAMLISMGRAKESLEISRRALSLGEEIKQFETDEFEQMHDVSHYNICKSLVFLGDYQNALAQLQSDLINLSELRRKNPTDTRYTYELWAYQRGLSIIFERTGEIRAASEALKTSLELIESLHRSSPDDIGYQRNTAFTLIALGQFWLRQNNAEKALPYFLRAREMSEKIYAADPEKGETIADLARIYGGSGFSQGLLGSREEGLQSLRKSLVFYEKALTRDPDNALLQRDYAETLSRTAEVLRKNETADNFTQSKEFYAKSLTIWRDLQTKNLLSAVDLKLPDETAAKAEKLNSRAIK